MTSCVYLSILIPENNVNKANTRLKRKRDETVPIENSFLACYFLEKLAAFLTLIIIMKLIIIL